MTLVALSSLSRVAPRTRPTGGARLVAFLAILAALEGCERHGVRGLSLSRDALGDAGLSEALDQTLGVRLEPGHNVTFANDARIFDALARDIESATSSVNVLIYIWEKGAASDRIVAALTARARAGVTCRVLVDAFGSSAFADDLRPALVASGCDVRIFRPVPGGRDDTARSHRKLVVVDGRVGFTGGFGIRDSWLGGGTGNDALAWRDTNVRVEGPAVADMQRAFAESWQEAGGPLLPKASFSPAGAVDAGAKGDSSTVRAAFVASTGSPVVTRAERLTQVAIASARSRLWITNAYFVPSDALLALLEEKAKAGVDVRLLTPGTKSDSKTSLFAQKREYGSLLDRGVRVFEYQPVMIHAKTMVIDDDRIVVGSINLDPLSLNRLDEGALVAQDVGVARALAEAFVDDCAHAKELKPH